MDRGPKRPLLVAFGLVKLGLDRLDGGPNVLKPGGSGVFTPLFSINTDGVLAEEIRTNRQFRRRTNAIRAGDPVLHDTASIVGPGPLPRRGWKSLAQPLGVDRQGCLRNNYDTSLSDKKASSWEISPGFVCPQTTSQARERRRRRSRRAMKSTPRSHRAPQQKVRPQNDGSRRVRHRRDKTASRSEPLDSATTDVSVRATGRYRLPSRLRHRNQRRTGSGVEAPGAFVHFSVRRSRQRERRARRTPHRSVMSTRAFYGRERNK